MTIERVPLDRVDDLIATGELIDAKSIIGLLLARQFLARVARSASMGDELDGLLAEHDTWLRVERGLAPNSLAAYRRDLRRYAAYLRRRGFTGDVAHVDEAIVAGYVDELQQARTDDGQRRYKESSIARALAAVRSFHRFCVEEGLLDDDPSEERRRAPRAPGHPEGAHRGRGRRAARRGARRRPAPATRPRHPRDCSTRAGCASASWSASTSATSISTTAWCACSARAPRSGSCRSAAPRAKPWATTSRPGVPSSCGRRAASRRCSSTRAVGA